MSVKKIIEHKFEDEDEIIDKKKIVNKSSITQRLSEKFGKESFVNINDDNTVKTVISTGSVGLNKALGVGGLPTGRIVEIFGAEQSGKTTLALHIIAEAQKSAYIESFLKAIKSTNKKVDFKNIARIIYDCLTFKNKTMTKEININLNDIVCHLLTLSTVKEMSDYIEKCKNTWNKNIDQALVNKLAKLNIIKINVEKHVAKYTISDDKKTDDIEQKRLYYTQILNNVINSIKKQHEMFGAKYKDIQNNMIEILNKFIFDLDYCDWVECFKSGVKFNEIIMDQVNGIIKVRIAAFVDLEKSFNTELANNIGVDTSPDRLLQLDPSSAEQAFNMLDEMCRSSEVNVIVLDSVAALIPQAESDGEMGDVTIGSQARLMSQCLRKLVSSAQSGDTLMIFINQVRHKLNIGYGPAANAMTTTGGKALLFYSSIRLEVKKVSLLQNTKDGAYGQRVRIKIIKNKFAPPFREIEFDLLFGPGIDKHSELIEVAIENGVLQTKGSWIYMNENRLANGKINLIEVLKTNNNLYNSIYDAIIEYKTDI
jgi:protein RecA